MDGGRGRADADADGETRRGGRDDQKVRQRCQKFRRWEVRSPGGGRGRRGGRGKRAGRRLDG